MGAGVIGPLVGLFRGRSFAAMKSSALRGGKLGFLIMIPVSMALTAKKTSGFDKDAFYDRAFRLRHNEGQV